MPSHKGTVKDRASTNLPNCQEAATSTEEKPAAEPQSKPEKRSKKDRPADAATPVAASSASTDNGQGNSQEAPRHRGKRSATPSSASGPSEEQKDDEEGFQSFRKSIKTYTKRDVRKSEFYWYPYIARGIYTLIGGEQGVGKTSFGMHLISMAKRALILPGEEPIKQVVIPRLVAAGVDPKQHIIIPAGDDLRLPSMASYLERLVRTEGIDLIFGDPIDDYTDHALDDNQNGPMREFLNVFLHVTSENNIAAALVRHPGKAWGNIFAGSRAFLQHPCASLNLVGQLGVRDRGQLHVKKPPYGVYTPPCQYELKGRKGKPKTFVLGAPVEEGEAREALEVPDCMERKKIDRAASIVERVLRGKGEVNAEEVFKPCEAVKLHPSNVYRAADRLGVTMRTSRKQGQVVTLWSLSNKRA